MNQTVMTLNLLGIPTVIKRSALIATGALWITMMLLAILLTSLTPLDAFIVGLLAAVLWWVSELAHQYGHYRAGKRVGYTFNRMTTLWLFAPTRYPADEPTLAPNIHIQRALGGPIFSLMLGVIMLALYRVIEQGEALNFLLLFMIIINIGVFGLGAFMPLRTPTFETDGGTILYWMRQSSRT